MNEQETDGMNFRFRMTLSWGWVAVLVAVVVLGSAAACRTGRLGVTNFDSLTLDNDLVVGDDASIAGDLTVTGAVAGAITPDLNGAALVIDATGNTALRATQDNRPILTLGGTPTAASFTVRDSAGTPAAVIRGNGELSALRILVAATAAPLVGVASTEVAPTGLLQPVSMATAGTVPITIPPAGSVICIWNTGSEVVTIADTGNQVLTASAALGQYDVLCGISDGTRFIETSRANN